MRTTTYGTHGPSAARDALRVAAGGHLPQGRLRERVPVTTRRLAVSRVRAPIEGWSTSPIAREAPIRRPETLADHRGAPTPATSGAPIVAAVDGSRASAGAVATAVELASQLDAPVVFVYVRRGPAGILGSPVYQRRLTTEMARGRKVLDDALARAASVGLDAESEILEGSARRRIAEFARDRSARLVVVGSRRRKLGRSVSRGVVRAAGRPVVVARGLQRPTIAGKAA